MKRKLLDKRERIMLVALELFSERGYYGTPVSLIATRAGVGSGTIYRYFKDKDDLVNTLFRHWKQIESEHILGRIDQAAPIRSIFQDIWMKFTQFAMQYRDAFLFLETHHHFPYLDDASRRAAETINLHFLDIILRGQQLALIKPIPPELLKSVMFGIMTEMMKNHWNNTQILTEAMNIQVEEIAWQAVSR